MLSKNKKVLFEKVFFLATVFEKATGLMCSRKIKDAYIFVFEKERRMDLHMMLVFFPIDVLFLDKNKKIIEIKENFRPFTFYYSKKKAIYVIEVPDGSIRKFKLRINDSLEF